MIYFKYLVSLLKHKWYFLIAGLRIGVPVWSCITHDMSKFSPSEFPVYAQWNYGEKDINKWMYAWIHHLHHNPHHPGHWTFSWMGSRNIYDSCAMIRTINISTCVMPPRYVLEMVADWLASSKAYTKSWDISTYINVADFDREFTLGTKNTLSNILYDIGLVQTTDEYWSWEESHKFWQIFP